MPWDDLTAPRSSAREGAPQRGSSWWSEGRVEGEKEGEESRLQWSLSGTVIDKVVFLCGRDVLQGRIPLREGRLQALVVVAAENARRIL